MTQIPTHSDLGQLVVAAFLNAGWRPGLTLEASDIADFFESAELTRPHARIGLDYAVEMSDERGSSVSITCIPRYVLRRLSPVRRDIAWTTWSDTSS